MSKLTQKEIEAKLVKEYFVENEKDLNLVELGASMEGETCFRTRSFCNCKCGNGIIKREQKDSVLITVGDYIKMNVILCPECAAKRYGKAKPFEKYIMVALEAERSKS